ncbi:hypothetical protein AAF712_013948 [Marasmius tenuissimus]|uniref:DNA 3'-5' helicase n=1 Tax=Marasmius tenuissimus TaxID=585030 RepID=A0ABR2ZCJ8_9AGAR
MLGRTVTIQRRPDGFYDCPCGAPPHRLLDWQKMRRLCLLEKHPGDQDRNPYPDEPFERYSQQALAKLQQHFGDEPYTLDEPHNIHCDPNVVEDRDGDVEMENVAVENTDSEVPANGESSRPLPDSIPNSTPYLDGIPPNPVDPILSMMEDVEIANKHDSDSDSSDGESVSDDEEEDHRTDGESDPVILLARWNIFVEPQLHRTVCTACRKLIEYPHMHSHQKKHHFKSRSIPSHLRLPSKESLVLILQSLDAHTPLPIQFSGIPSLEVAATVSGYKCLVEGCNWCYPKVQQMHVHLRKHHPDLVIHPKARVYPAVDLQATEGYRGKKRWFHVIRSTSSVLQVRDTLDKLAVGLDQPPETYRVSDSAQEKPAVLAQTSWDLLLQDVHIRSLRNLVNGSGAPEPHLDLLKTKIHEYYQGIAKALPNANTLTMRHLACEKKGETVPKPFGKLQESKTLTLYARVMSDFVSFFLRSLDVDVTNYPITLHPETRHQLSQLAAKLRDENTSSNELKISIHQTIWSFLCYPTREDSKSDHTCPLTRFLVAYHLLDDAGTFAGPKQLPPTLSQLQWCLRGTAANEIWRRMELEDTDSYSAYQQYVEQYVNDSTPSLFTSLQQNMSFLSALSFNEHEVPSLNFNHDYSVITVYNKPVVVDMLFTGIRDLIATTEQKIVKLFRGMSIAKFLARIDQALVPDKSSQGHWLRDKHEDKSWGYGFIFETLNGFDADRTALYDHLCRDPDLFTVTNKQVIPKTAAIREWLTDVDEVVQALFYLVFVTWGGGARGTEMQHLLYANRNTHTRHFIIVNGVPTIITSYNKTQSIVGAGKLIGRTAAPGVNRLLILVIWQVYFTCSRLSLSVGIEREDAARYLYEMFVLSGRSMTSDKFSKTLGHYTHLTTGARLTLQPFRQMMTALLIYFTQSTFNDPDDPDMKLVHESFGHGVSIGQSRYNVTFLTALTGIPVDGIAKMHIVCFKWQKSAGVLHPALEHNFDATNTNLNPSPTQASLALEAILRSNHRTTLNHVTDTVQASENRTRLFIRDELETHFTVHRDYMRMNPTSTTTWALAPPPRDAIHPRTREILGLVLGNQNTGRATKFTSPQQASIMQSVRSPYHILGVIETGGGKSAAFFGAPYFFPESLFVVVSPLVALTDDLYRRMRMHQFACGKWGEDGFDAMNAQLVLVGAHEAGTQSFQEWIGSPAIKKRLKRVFIDECHKVVTDKKFRSCFRVFEYLTEPGLPITFLSATMLPRSVPALLSSMHINDPKLVHEIHKNTARNIKYNVRKVDGELWMDHIRDYVHERLETMAEEDRGIVYTSTTSEARKLSSHLGCDFYISQVNPDPVLNKRIKKEIVEAWRNGTQRWVVATQAFGLGIDYHAVRHIVHWGPRKIIDFDQETGRAGRDGNPAYSMTFYSQLPLEFDPKDSEDGIDHHGRNEMRVFLETKSCVRLVFDVFGSECHSCHAIDAQECHNCERKAQEPFENLMTEFPRHDLPLAPTTANPLPGSSTTNTRPLTVEMNAKGIVDHHQYIDDQLQVLTRILSAAEATSCADCFVAGITHVDGSPPQNRGTLFSTTLTTTMNIGYTYSTRWPGCYICWVPWREPCGHEPTSAKGTVDRSRYKTTLPRKIPQSFPLSSPQYSRRLNLTNSRTSCIVTRLLENWESRRGPAYDSSGPG